MRHRTRLRYDDRGAVSVQLVLVVPALLILSLLAVQFALVWHAQHLAQFAAQDALAATRVKDAGTADGHAAARSRLKTLGGRVFTSPEVTVHRSKTHAGVRIEGRVLHVVPGLNLHASGAASGPVERLTTPTGEQP
ncbi:pilus assembly protein [Streptomyces armeniacus]|uniref:Pilus assembly protein n=1 Tax=Streptomyces armeniacus TaxID=83291 RepID=A0A345XW34_9ACTN|nr:TadE family protein [Streptomyces armeniacus]AXK35850.1 pilus assembly protein [Streptomyces armeniacus]